MRNFEKKLAVKLKGEIHRIVPECEGSEIEKKGDAEGEIRYAENPDIKKRKQFSGKRMIAAVAVVALILLSVFGFDSLFERKENGPSFQIIAFADSDGINENELEERLLDADISMIMPNGQIMLDLEHNSYGWGTGSFYVLGKDIDRVTYSLKKGMIRHYDTAEEYKQNIEGNPVRIEFFLPYAVLDLDESKLDEYKLESTYTERLKELWNSGECPELEAIKKSYFVGKSLDIDDYTIMNFVGTWKAAQTDGRYFRFRDISLDKQLNEEAHKVTVKYYHYDYGKDFNFDDSIYGVTWNPVFKPYSIIGVTNPEELPGDEMTVTVELKNGEILKKVILLNFDEEGYVVAKIKQ